MTDLAADDHMFRAEGQVVGKMIVDYSDTSSDEEEKEAPGNTRLPEDFIEFWLSFGTIPQRASIRNLVLRSAAAHDGDVIEYTVKRRCYSGLAAKMLDQTDFGWRHRFEDVPDHDNMSDYLERVQIQFNRGAKLNDYYSEQPLGATCCFVTGSHESLSGQNRFYHTLCAIFFRHLEQRVWQCVGVSLFQNKYSKITHIHSPINIGETTWCDLVVVDADEWLEELLYSPFHPISCVRNVHPDRIEKLKNECWFRFSRNACYISNRTIHKALARDCVWCRILSRIRTVGRVVG